MIKDKLPLLMIMCQPMVDCIHTVYINLILTDPIDDVNTLVTVAMSFPHLNVNNSVIS